MLTDNPHSDTFPLKEFLGVDMGNWREYRPGKWKLKFRYEGKLQEFYSNQHDEPLESAGMCARTMAYIEELIKEKRFHPTTWRKTGPHLFERACETWIQSSRRKAYGTFSARKRIVDQYLIPHFAGMDIKDITRSHLKEFKNSLEENEKDLSGKTIRNIIGELKTMMSFHLDIVPRFPTIEVVEPTLNWLTEEQQDQVFEFFDDDDRRIFTFQRYSGRRPNEARGLLKTRILWDKKIVVINTVRNEHDELIHWTKTKRPGIVPIIPEIEWTLRSKVLSPYAFTRNGEPWKKRTHENRWKKANLLAHEKYGTPLVSMYPGTKHSLGMNRLEQGFNKYELQAVYGHASIKSVDRYAKYLAERLVPVMRGRRVIPIKKAEGE